jgi:hypothetical protein
MSWVDEERSKRVQMRERLEIAEASSLLKPGFFTVWTGVPLDPPDAGPIPGFSRPDARMRGVRLFPLSHAFLLEDWVVGSLCEWLMRRKLPLFLRHTEIEWGALRSLALRHPGLRIVLETQEKKIIYHTRVLWETARAVYRL